MGNIIVGTTLGVSGFVVIGIMLSGWGDAIGGAMIWIGGLIVGDALAPTSQPKNNR